MARPKLGLNIWSLPRDMRSPTRVFEVAQSLGYQGVELAVGEWELHQSDAEVREAWRRIKRESENYGLEMPSVATPLYWRYGLIACREKALKLLEKQCTAAEAAEASIVLVTLGPPVPGLSYQGHIAKAVEALREAVKLASRYSVVIGLEPVWNRFMASPLEYRRVLDEVSSENLGLYLDVANPLPHSLPEHWIEVLGSWIVQVHAKDFSIERLEFTPPGRGDVDWNTVRELLGRIGFNGYVVVETPPNPENPTAPLKVSIEFLRKLWG